MLNLECAITLGGDGGVVCALLLGKVVHACGQRLLHAIMVMV